MMISEQMDVAIMNAIHFALSKDGGPGAVGLKSDPLLDYAEFLLFRLSPQTFEDTKRSFMMLPLRHMEASLAGRMLDTLPQLSVEQVTSPGLHPRSPR